MILPFVSKVTGSGTMYRMDFQITTSILTLESILLSWDSAKNREALNEDIGLWGYVVPGSPCG